MQWLENHDEGCSTDGRPSISIVHHLQEHKAQVSTFNERAAHDHQVHSVWSSSPFPSSSDDPAPPNVPDEPIEGETVNDTSNQQDVHDKPSQVGQEPL